MASVDLPTSHIFTRVDARKIDQAALRGLIDSIREVGIINPLRVRPARKFVEGFEADGWEVTAGNHRLDAAKQLHLPTVPCIIVDDDELHAELVMIDENLMRADLGEAEKSLNTCRRKEIVQLLRGDKFVVSEFERETAKTLNRAERTAQRVIHRGNSIDRNVLNEIKGTVLDNASYLDKIAKLELEKQKEKVDRDLRKETEIRAKKKLAKKRYTLSDEEAIEKQVDRLMTAWNAASPAARQAFLHRIDKQVIDAVEAA